MRTEAKVQEEQIQRAGTVQPGRGLNRRELGAVAGATVAGGVLGFFGRGLLDQDPKLAAADSRVYESGETIQDPAFPIQVKGWKFLVREADSSSYLDRNPEREVRVTLSGLHLVHKEQQPVLTVTNPGQKTTGGANITVVPDERGGKKLGLYGFPPDASSPLHLTVTEQGKGGGETIRQDTYPTKLRFWQVPGSNDSPFSLYSEKPLSGDSQAIASDLGERFGRFSPSPDIFLFDASRRDGLPLMHSGVPIALESFESPVVDHEAEMKLTFQLGQGLATAASRDQTVEFALAYKKYFQETQQDLNHPLYALFDLASYLGQEGRLVAQSDRPLSFEGQFASFLTLGRYNAAEFRQRFQALSPEHQALAASSVGAALSTLRDLNPSQEALEDLIPDVRLLQPPAA